MLEFISEEQQDHCQICGVLNVAFSTSLEFIDAMKTDDQQRVLVPVSHGIPLGYLVLPKTYWHVDWLLCIVPRNCINECVCVTRV